MGKFLGTALWWLFGGLVLVAEYFVVGLLWCISIIGIPVGLQMFKLGKVMLLPFHTEVGESSGDLFGCLGNTLWIIFGGLILALSHLVVGVLLCVTIIGIPFGTQHFKFAKVAFTPFGREVTTIV